MGLMDEGKIHRFCKLLPDDQKKALEFIRKQCSLKEGFLPSELPHDSDYFAWMNAFRKKFVK